MEDKKLKILEAALPLIKENGWSDETCTKAVKDAGFADEDMMIAFPDGMRDVLKFYFEKADQDMITALEKLPLDDLRIRDRIRLAVTTRLDQADKDLVRKTLTQLAKPGYHTLSMKSLYHTVDHMWYMAGDRSTDWNFYSKRMLLSGVYTSTLMYWLNDDSPDNIKTKSFLDRRIENVMMVPKIKNTIKSFLKFTNDRS